MFLFIVLLIVFKFNQKQTSAIRKTFIKEDLKQKNSAWILEKPADKRISCGKKKLEASLLWNIHTVRMALVI
jgi:hypothetical protein